MVIGSNYLLLSFTLLQIVQGKSIMRQDRLLCIYTIGIFELVPVTQYVYLNDTVTFECATNLTGYTISFLFGTDPMDTVTDLCNGGKRTTFTATSGINGTNIICLARMGIMTFNTDAAYLYIQGMPMVRIIFYLYSQVLLIVLVIFKGIS